MKFEPFPKIPRFNRTAMVTEKIDGTNASVWIMPQLDAGDAPDVGHWYDEAAGTDMVMLAGSRKRWLTPDADNFGFAQWVIANRDRLRNLGEGRHFGEWWGSGIQRRYDLDHRRFSLFNAKRWSGGEAEEFTDRTACHVVPTLSIREMHDLPIPAILDDLRRNGSKAAPGFMQPEGIVIFHTASRQVYKVTLDNDQLPKGLVHGQ